MKTLTLLAVLSLGSCGRVAFAQEPPKPNHALAWSIAAMSAASAADAYTSWHRGELNPVLASNGRFETKAISIKVGALVGMLVMEYKMRRDPEMRKPMIFMNWASAGLFGTVAAHNARLGK